MNHVDTHFHIWDLEKFQYDWPDAESPKLFRDISIEEYELEIRETPVKHAVFIQILNGNPDEAKWVIQIAQKHPFIKGIIAGVDLTSHELPSILDDLQKSKLFKGCRHVLEVEDDIFFTRKDVFRGLQLLESRGLTFDLLLRPHLMKYVPDVIRQLPNLKIVVDHIAMPCIKDKAFSPWDKELQTIAQFKNVHCKISGLVTEADLQHWKKEDIQPYVDHALRCFGIDRCMFGSDWPVCMEAGCSFADIYTLSNAFFPTLTQVEKWKLYKDNARKFYNLEL